MTLRSPSAASSAAPANWLVDESPTIEYRVRSLIPEGFNAYVRVFHPAQGKDGSEARDEIPWHHISAQYNKPMHPEVQWEDLVGHFLEEVGVDYPWPLIGRLPMPLRQRIIHRIKRHTQSDIYWMAWWDGYSYFYYLPLGIAKFQRSLRNYALTYSLDPLVNLDLGFSVHSKHTCSPQLLWPDDRSWIVATEIDLTSTYVAGSNHLAEDLLSDDCIEALRVEPHHKICLDPLVWG